MDIVTDRVKHFFLKINSSLARISAGRAVERERERDSLEERKRVMLSIWERKKRFVEEVGNIDTREVIGSWILKSTGGTGSALFSLSFVFSLEKKEKGGRRRRRKWRVTEVSKAREFRNYPNFVARARIFHSRN